MKTRIQPVGTIALAQLKASSPMFLRVWPVVLVTLMTSCASPQGDKQVNIATSRPLNFFHLMSRSETLPTLAMSVNSYRDPERDLVAITTYDFEYTSKDNPLLEKELLKTAEFELDRRGLKRNRENPDVLITMNYYLGKKEQYTPPKTVVSTRFETVWNTGLIGWTPMGFSSVVPVTESSTEPGEKETSYFCSFRLNFLDAAVLRSGKKPETPPLLWIGEAQSEDVERTNNDIRSMYAGPLLRSLLFEFPNQSKLGPKRRYQWATFGAIGTTLCSEDWQLVREVERSSPADVAGIRPGDRIVAIEGKKMARGWNTYDRSEYRWKNTNRFLADDPWYNYIMKNPDGREVELTIQGQEGGIPRKVRLTPQVQEHGLFFTTYSYSPVYGYDYGTVYDQY